MSRKLKRFSPFTASGRQGLLRALIRRTGLHEVIAAEAAKQARAQIKEAAKQSRELAVEQERLAAERHKSLLEAERRIRRLEGMVKDGLPNGPPTKPLALFNADVLAPHLRERIEAAELIDHPYPHLFVEEFLPGELYDYVVAAMPPAHFFSGTPVKRSFQADSKLLPRKVAQAWNFLVEHLLPQIVAPALVAKFDGFLDHHYGWVFGREFIDGARALPQTASSGRVMWCRPGYHQPPHLDPKRVLLTGLLYMPQGESRDERYGTQLFRVERDISVRYANTYYPEQDGIKCTLEKTLPYRENALLVFLNSGGAHGVDLPRDMDRPDFDRFLFQFYIAPEQQALDQLIGRLPEERQREWQERSR